MRAEDQTVSEALDQLDTPIPYNLTQAGLEAVDRNHREIAAAAYKMGRGDERKGVKVEPDFSVVATAALFDPATAVQTNTEELGAAVETALNSVIDAGVEIATIVERTIGELEDAGLDAAEYHDALLAWGKANGRLSFARRRLAEVQA